MATIINPASTTGTASKYLLPVYYDKVLLERLIPKLRWMEIVEKKQFPKNSGKVIKFSAYQRFVNDAHLTEGTIPTALALSSFNVTATLRQFGNFIAVTDVMEVTGITSIMKDGVSLMGENIAYNIDTEIRNTAFGGRFPSTTGTQNISAGGRLRYTGSVSALSALNNKIFGFTIKMCGAISAGLTKNLSGFAAAMNQSAWVGKGIVLRDVRNAVAFLRGNNVLPMGDNFYRGIGHPFAFVSIANDTQTTGWNDWVKYTDRTSMMKGEIGAAEGVRFVQSTNAMHRAANKGSNISATFITIVGQGAIGVVDFDNPLDGNGAEYTIIKRANQYDMSDPLSQIAGTVATKVTFAAAILNVSCGVHLMGIWAGK